jgi:hypothetical protein
MDHGLGIRNAKRATHVHVPDLILNLRVPVCMGAANLGDTILQVTEATIQPAWACSS